MTESIVLHRAPWVFPVTRPALQNGAVAVCSGTIEDVGTFGVLSKSFPGARIIDYPDSALIPALINAHTHLELSNLSGLTQTFQPDSFTGWIAHMLAERKKRGFAGPSVLQAARQALADQQEDGVAVVGDISNTGVPRDLASEFEGELLCFKEFYGLSPSQVRPILQSAEAEGDHLCTAHAPYSTHAELLQGLKGRARTLDHIFPLHVAEPASEAEMMSQGTGELPEFFQQRGFWDNSFQPTAIDNTGSVQYLHQLGLLDEKTLCVHCVHVAEKEFSILQSTGCQICLCPGSNRYLKVGKAPVERFLSLGILPALGTDSLASNPEISLWREMLVLGQDHPAIRPADIVAMATLGGSRALGIANSLGSLEKGKRAAMLAVSLQSSGKKVESVMEELVTQRNRPFLQRIIPQSSRVSHVEEVD